MNRLLRPSSLGFVLLTLALSVLVGCGTASTESTTTALPATTASSVTTVPGVTETSASPTSSVPAKVQKLTLVAPPGPMAIPMAYLVVNDKLAEVAESTEVIVWENVEQLKAMVAGKQGDLVTVPSNTSAIFYNKGLELKSLDISVWNITYLVTPDPQADSFSDIKGKSLVVPFQGSVPDVMFQYLAKSEGLDPQKDFALRYATDPTQASQLLLSGQVENAVLSEALTTAVILQSRSTDRPLYRSLAFDQAWVKAVGAGATTPIAGTVAAASVLDKPQVIAVFQREYAAAVDWMLANPEAAGKLVETELPQLGLKAAVMTEALKNITWRYTPAPQARASLEAFYTVLSSLSPEVIGGKLPDDGFYYAP
jgi:NitT/TauT family transport system substrate-binding protein